MITYEIGTPIRVDFVKEAKAACIYGNFYTRDPESGSVVLAQSLLNASLNDGDPAGCCPTKIVLIPGSSVQSVQPVPVDDDGVQDENDGMTKSRVECRDDAGYGAATPSPEFAKSIQQMFDWQTAPSPRHRDESTDVATPSKSRTIRETMRIFAEFVQQKRCRVVDALNKYGIEFTEQPYSPFTKDASAEGKQPKTGSAASTSTVIVIGDCLKIYPPYGKNEIVGANKAVKDLVFKLCTENALDD